MSTSPYHQQWRTARRGQLELLRDRAGRICHRVPVWVVQLHGHNDVGWWGWDPLNERWVSAPYGVAFGYHSSLHEALEFINWRRHRLNPCTHNWLGLYPLNSVYARLSRQQRMLLAEMITAQPLTVRAQRKGNMP